MKKWWTIGAALAAAISTSTSIGYFLVPTGNRGAELFAALLASASAGPFAAFLLNTHGGSLTFSIVGLCFVSICAFLFRKGPAGPGFFACAQLWTGYGVFALLLASI